MTQEKETNREVTVPQQAGAVTAIAPADMDMAKALVASGFFPTIKTASQALVKIQLGRELGFGPVSSMMGVHVWSDRVGRTTVQLGANLIANLVRRSKVYDFRILALNDEECSIRFLRSGEAIGESKFNLSHAKRAGLLTKDVWQAHPRNMLFAAAMRNGAKWFCSEVLLGTAIPVSGDEPAEESGPADDDLRTIEGAGVNRETGEIREEALPVVTEPPEGYKVNWSEFWVRARDLGFDKDDAHAFFGVKPGNGALMDYVTTTAASEDKTAAEVVAEMILALDHEADRRVVDPPLALPHDPPPDPERGPAWIQGTIWERKPLPHDRQGVVGEGAE